MTFMKTVMQRPTGLARGFEDDMARGVTGGMSEAAQMAKERLAEATWRANSGKNKLPKTWRARVFPVGQDSVDAVAWVDTRAPKLMKVFAEGATITAPGGKWMAIPTDAAGAWGLRPGAGFRATVNTRGMRERVTPRGFERRTGLKLRFVAEGSSFAAREARLVVDEAKRNRKTGIAAPYGPGSGAKLYGPKGRTITVFILTRVSRRKKAMDVETEVAPVRAQVPTLIAKHWR